MEDKKIRSSIFKSGYEPVQNIIDVPLMISSTGFSLFSKGEFSEKGGIISRFVEIFWCVSGIGEIELYGRKYKMQKNDVFYYLPGEDRFLKSLSDDWGIRWFCFHGKFAEAMMLSYNYPRHQNSAHPYPKQKFQEIEQLISLTDPYSIRRNGALILEILACMGRQYGTGIHSGKIVQYAIDIILNNLSDPQLGLSMLSEMLNVAPSTLSRIFKNETSVSPGRYILDKRQSRALSLLQGTDLSIGEIAKQCGFSDRRTFTRFIRRCCSVSPLTYRKQQNGKA